MTWDAKCIIAKTVHGVTEIIGKISKIDLRKVLENKQYTHPDLK